MPEVIDEQDQDTGLDPALRELVQDPTEDQPDYLYCAACSAVVSKVSAAIDVNGSHEHFCTNPHGFDFHIGCFSEALGCNIGGEREHADSWFAGYHWRYASCADCQQHLGWYFDRSEHYFYGLILDRVQS